MKKLYKPAFFICLSIFCLYTNFLKAQPLAWEKLYESGFTYQTSRIDDVSFYVTGANSNHTSSAVMKVDHYGNIIWTKQLSSSSTSYAKAILTTVDNGCIIGGIYQGKSSLWKYDGEGNLLWIKSFDFSNDFLKIVRGSNAYYAVAENLVYKFDTEGNLIWAKTFSSQYPGAKLKDLCFEPESNSIICVGSIFIGYPVTDGFLGKIDAEGNILAQKQYKMLWKATFFDNISRYDNDYFVGGRTCDSNSFYSKVFLTRINSSCDVVFKKILTEDYDEQLQSFYVSGQNRLMYSSFIAVRPENPIAKLRFFSTDKFGNILQSKMINTDGTKWINNGIPLSTTFNIFAGYKVNAMYGSDYKMLIIKMDSLLDFQSVGVSNINSGIPDKFSLYQNYPNPFNPNTVISYKLSVAGNISLNVYNTNGQLIKILESGFKQAGNYSTNFSAEGLSSGVYYYSLYADGVLMDTKKAVVMK